MIALAIYTMYVEPRLFRTVKSEMRTGRAFGGKLDILHISDLHLKRGNTPKLKFLRGLQDTPVDLVFVTGDLIEDDSGIDYCVETLRGFKPSIGTFAIFGAHDRWDSTPLKVALDLSTGRYHPGRPNDFERLRRELEKAGVICLVNESHRVALCGQSTGETEPESELWIAGIDDKFVELDDMGKAIDGVPHDAFRILLTHTIESPQELAGYGFDAVFAGHSHGGQVRLPILGPIITRSSLPREFARGVFEVDGTSFHINNGIGTGQWTPFRLLCRPEATFITLTGGESAKKVR